MHNNNDDDDDHQGHRRHRRVVMTRNFVDALVSGYLYHKAGYECSRDMYGNTARKKKEKKNAASGIGAGKNATTTSNNSTVVFYHHLHYIPWGENLLSAQPGTAWDRTVTPQRIAGRDICQYLADEAEHEGMMAYVDFALGYWYKPFYTYWKQEQQRQKQRRRQQQQQESLSSSTLFVCYEDLVNPETKMVTLQRILDWMHPATTTAAGDRLSRQLRLLPPSQQHQQKNAVAAYYAGPHATNHDPKLRSRLGNLVQTLDRQVFDRWIEHANAAFGCAGSSIDYSTVA